MKNSIKLSIVVIATMFAACNHSSNRSRVFHAIDTNKLAKGTVYYQCSMHPDQVTDTTDTCPACDDELVKHVKQ